MSAQTPAAAAAAAAAANKDKKPLDELDVFQREHLTHYFALGYTDANHAFTGASGFFVQATVRNEKRLFFVTTAHKMGAGSSQHRARKITLSLHWPTSKNFSPVTINLEHWADVKDTATGTTHRVLQPQWLFDRHSDVAIVPISQDVAKQLDARDVDQVPPFDIKVPFYFPGQRMLHAGEQIFVQGFPGHFANNELPWATRHPIWTRAMIVYPPNDDFNGLPTVLLHGHGMNAMSGSLAFTVVDDSFKIQPVGVYSGEQHYPHEHLTGPNVSNVWKWSCLVNLISNYAGHDIKDVDVRVVSILPLF